MKVIKIEKFYLENKTWIKVELDNRQTWVPSFDELGKILSLIGQCEDEKYPYGKGLELVYEFFCDMSYEEFCKNKGIPTSLI